MYFDHYGEALTSNFSTEGSFGLSTSLSNPAGVYSYTSSPKFPRVPPLHRAEQSACNPLACSVFSSLFPLCSARRIFSSSPLAWMIGSRHPTPKLSISLSSASFRAASFLKKPTWAALADISSSNLISQNLSTITTERWRNLLPAAAQLSKAVDQNRGCYYNVTNGSNCGLTAPVHVATEPYFENVFPQMANVDYPGESATDGAYNNEWAPYRYSEGETTSLADIDFYCGYGGYCANGASKFWQSQFSSLYAWSTIGNSSYNALQASIRHPASHGVSVDVSYTLSKSIDMNSGTERASEFSNDGLGGSAIQNSWFPKLNKSVSDFDTRHLVNGDLVYDLPVGRGKKFLGASNVLVDSFLGGWTYAGLARWTSGLPFSLFEPGWSTDWQLEGYGVKTGYVKTRKHYDAANLQEQVFDNPAAINAGVTTNNGPVRLPYPGEAGSRNVFRGDGYFDIDSTLSKVWKVSEFGKLKFDAEVYNITNTNRFDTSSLSSGLTGGSLGAYGSTLPAQSNFRRMQFGLRFDF